MASKQKKRPRDPVQLAKLVGDIATGQAEDDEERKKQSSASQKGKVGGRKGGKARAKKLTPEQRKEIARIAAAARWKKSD